jgi:hypothetical protein
LDYSKPKTSSGVQEQHNVLVVAPLFTRFSLLPISTPPMKIAPSSVPSGTVLRKQISD